MFKLVIWSVFYSEIVLTDAINFVSIKEKRQTQKFAVKIL